MQFAPIGIFARDIAGNRDWCGADELLHPRKALASADHGNIRSQLLEIDEDDFDPYDVSVSLDGQEVWVQVHPGRGPMWGLGEGDYVQLKDYLPERKPKKWTALTLSEKELCLVSIAKKMQFLSARLGKSLGQRRSSAIDDQGPQKTAEELEAESRERIAARCAMELRRKPATWRTIEIEDVTRNHDKRARGMLYGLEFPWTEEMLMSMGPEWLTEAFHAAGTLDEGNRVVKIIPERRVTVTTGNNGGKFLFEVRYKVGRPHLHTQLFAKVPYPLEGATKTDRLSSSVNKQPAEFHEINANRLLEGSLPVAIPRFYFGDVSNVTSNWILITARVPFADRASQNYGKPKPRKGPLRPYMIEGPYDKCLDHNLRGPPREYYMLLVRTGAKMAGMYKAGKICSKGVVASSFGSMEDRDMLSFGMSVLGVSGEDPRMLKQRLSLGVEFITDTARAIFPACVATQEFQDRFWDCLITLNAYTTELNFWKHMDQEYIALVHVNLNVDNAYFWRTAEGELDLGVMDWGGMGSFCVGHRLWWWLYCQDYGVFKKNLPAYVAAFVETYEEHGGPRLDGDALHMMVIITAMQQMLGLISAVPQITRMCPKKEWPTIENRYDPRISANVDGKSSLRLYLHVMNSIIRIMTEMDGFELLDRWIQTQWVGRMKQTAKSEEMKNSPPTGARM